MNSVTRQSGFTLIEIAIVLLVVAILLGYTVAMLPVQQELKQYRHANAEMDSIIEHLIAFAQVNGRLPCPDTSGNVNTAGAGVLDGVEDSDDLVDNVTGNTGADGLVDNCKAFFGFLPGRTLGINGKYDDAGRLIDPWGTGYLYAVSAVDAGDGNLDLVTGNGIREEGLAAVIPDLRVCSNSAGAGNQTACGAGEEVIRDVAVIIISLGKDFTLPASSGIQGENVDDFHVGTNDKVYIFSPRRDDYDDVVKWIPRSLLFSRMLAADQLP